MRIANIIQDSIVDGLGFRMVVFTQGCPHHCPGCHNPSTWSYDDGYEMNINTIIDIYKSNPMLDGITLSGGEPFIPERKDELLKLVKEVKHLGGNVWAYTGYQLEDISDEYRDILQEVDYLVDGRFIIDKRNLSISFRGSDNQRIMKNNKDNTWTDISSHLDTK